MSIFAWRVIMLFGNIGMMTGFPRWRVHRRAREVLQGIVEVPLANAKMARRIVVR